MYSKNKAILTEKCKIQRPKKNADAILKKAAQLYANISDGYTLDDANADFTPGLGYKMTLVVEKRHTTK